jgi:hypothetical protein
LALGVVAYQSLRRQFGSKSILTAAEKERGDSIPYAPAITLGVWLSLMPKS